nr:hypothetical protein [Bacillus tequilensis]
MYELTVDGRLERLPGGGRFQYVGMAGKKKDHVLFYLPHCGRSPIRVCQT